MYRITAASYQSNWITLNARSRANFLTVCDWRFSYWLLKLDVKTQSNPFELAAIVEISVNEVIHLSEFLNWYFWRFFLFDQKLKKKKKLRKIACKWKPKFTTKMAVQRKYWLEVCQQFRHRYGGSLHKNQFDRFQSQ